MAVYEPITAAAIVGNCLSNQIKKGNLRVNVVKLAMPYILIKLIECDTITDKQLLYSRYNDLIRDCGAATTTTTTSIPDSIILETGDYLLLESGDYLLLE